MYYKSWITEKTNKTIEPFCNLQNVKMELILPGQWLKMHAYLTMTEYKRFNNLLQSSNFCYLTLVKYNAKK